MLLGIFLKGIKQYFRTKLSQEKSYGKLKITMKAIIMSYLPFCIFLPFWWATLVLTEFNMHAYILTRIFTRIKNLNNFYPLENSKMFMSRSTTQTVLDEQDSKRMGTVKEKKWK